MNVDSPLILAVDSLEISQARKLIEETGDFIGIYKFGLEFYLRNGLTAMQKLKSEYPELRIFLDLKLHDIPNTVTKAAGAVSAISPEILTVHASGGEAMIRGAKSVLPKTMIAAVTILTSLTQADLDELGFQNDIESLVFDLATTAQAAGAQAIVSSPLELKNLRSNFPGLKLITPGIRQADAPLDDQSRTMTARQALEAGADFLVIGRPIAGADNPKKAAASIYASLG